MCAKLHNLCLDRLVEEKYHDSVMEESEISMNLSGVPSHGCSKNVWNHLDASLGLDDIADPSFVKKRNEFHGRFDNQYPSKEQGRQESVRYITKRYQIMQHFYACGLRFNLETKKVYKI